MNKVVGIISNPDKAGTVKTASELLTCLSAFKDVDFLLDQHLSDALSLKNRYASDADMAEKAHLVVVLGGDGTLLCSVKRIRKDMIPFLGINHGGLGFLAEFTIERFKDVVRDLLEDVLVLEKRMMLDIKLVCATPKTDEAEAHYEALNDCVLTKGFFSRVLHFEVYINDQFLNTYDADGFIIATPTGSTAYSLSCGGPLVSPDTEVLILTPISPHTLSNRPLIVGADKLIKVMLKKGDKEVGLTIDGQIGRVLKESDFIEVSRSKRYVHMVESGYDYFEILREKLGWRGTSANRSFPL